MTWNLNNESLELKDRIKDLIEKSGWPREEINIQIAFQGCIVILPGTIKMSGDYGEDFIAKTDNEITVIDRCKIPSIHVIDLVRKKTEKPFNPNDRIGDGR